MYEENIPDLLNFRPNFLNYILYHCITNDDFLKKVKIHLEPKIFKTKERIFLCELIYKYYDEYKKAPKDDFLPIFEEEKDSISSSLYDRCMAIISFMKGIKKSNSDFVLNNIHRAIRHLAIEEAIVKSAQLIKSKQYEEAKRIFLEALKKPEEIKLTNYDYFKDKTYVEERLEGKTYKMKSLINGLDRLIGGFNPTWLTTILAKAKGGKTTLLVELAIAAAQQGLKVLFVSLEMNKTEIDNCFDMALGGLGDKPNEKVDTYIYKGTNWIKIKRKIPTIFDIDKVSKNREIMAKQGGKIIIADRSSLKFNYRDAENLLDELQETHGIIFDVLIVDYLGEMGKTEPTQSKKERISANTSGLKGIGKDYNLIVFSAMQGNRKAMNVDVFSSDLISDAIEPIFVSDLVLAICQNDEEEKNDLSRIFVAEYRHGPKHTSVTLLRDLNTKQIALDETKPLQKKAKKHKLNKFDKEDFGEY